MADSLPISLFVTSPDGRSQPVLKRGAKLPGEGKVVFATQRAGERSLAFLLSEDFGGGPVPAAAAAAELPPGLPPNTWVAVFVRVDEALGVKVEVRENLRRIRLDASITPIEKVQARLVYTA